MTNERELLRRALVYLSGLPARTYIQDDIEAYLSTEPEAEPVAWIQPNHLEKAQFMPHLCRVEPKQRANFVPLYLHPPNPAEPEAETIETLKAENFKLASGQCTEGGPWGDEGGTPYCKYAEPAARKPMNDDL